MTLQNVSLKPPMLRSKGPLSTFSLRRMHHHAIRTFPVAILKVGEVRYPAHLDQQFALLVEVSSKRGSDTWMV